MVDFGESDKMIKISRKVNNSNTYKCFIKIFRLIYPLSHLFLLRSIFLKQNAKSDFKKTAVL